LGTGRPHEPVEARPTAITFIFLLPTNSIDFLVTFERS
jgi:hypothetical protein